MQTQGQAGPKDTLQKVELAERDGYILVTVLGLTPRGDRNTMMTRQEAQVQYPEFFLQVGD